MPMGQGQTQFHDVGVAVFPSPKVVLKATYQKVINKDPAGANADTFLGGCRFLLLTRKSNVLAQSDGIAC